MRVRRILVVTHRYVGLAMAAFLLLAGLTGALLTWYEELDGWTNSSLMRVSAPGPNALMLDPLVLRQKVQDLHPEAYAAIAYLPQEPAHAAIVRLFAIPDPSASQQIEPKNDHVYVNPYTGEILGARKWGDISQGMKNLMPFIYRLHYSLALDSVGTYLMGFVALLWMLDCFVGAWLTLPVPERKGHTLPQASFSLPKREKKSWLIRWLPSWKLRMISGSYKFSFDLHRAGGLWAWVMLFVLAFSSVSFNLHKEVYDPVMRRLFEHQPNEESLVPSQRLNLNPALGWEAARERGRRLMSEQALKHGFTIQSEVLLAHDPRRGQNGTWRYMVKSSRDIRDRWGSTQVIFDADTGELLRLWLPTGAASGDTVRTWLTSLHMAAIWGIPFKLFMSAIGILVTALSFTGVVIWSKKRRARRQALNSTYEKGHIDPQ